jgi:cysteinyl-tRNA synthetase
MLQIYNTLTRQKEVFKPLKPGQIGFYVCGVTVYDFCHLGHARTYTAVDMIVRYLRSQDYQVKYVRNITDIDDKIIKRANENNETYTDVTQRFIKAMHEDFHSLMLLPPDDEPKATDYIPHMIQLIHELTENGHAYVGQNGDVYFDVRNFNDYGCLSNHNIEQLESGARVEVSEVKRDPLDFALWKIAKTGEPSWDSPWGKGRPGWHIECSAMSSDLLGTHFDIHAGGRDLIFPHHENELAQSRAAQDTPFVNLWMHTGYLQIDEAKMSKSLGNFVTIRDVLKDHDSEVLRLFFLMSHYRSPLIYTEDTLAQAKQSLSRLYTALRFIKLSEPIQNSSYEVKFHAAMRDDFNTPIAISILFDLAHDMNRLRENNVNELSSHAGLLKQLAGILGLLQKNPEDYFQADLSMNIDQIESLIAARNAARVARDWAEADRIRSEIAALGVAIEDSAAGTTWKIMK